MIWALAILCAGFAAAAVYFGFQTRRLRALYAESEIRCRSSDENLNRTRAETRAILGVSAEAILVLDSAQTILQANEVAKAIFRDRPGGLVGRTLLQATLSAELGELVSEALSGAPSRGREIRLPGSGGHNLIVSAIPVTPSPQAPAECLLVVQDVTELRRLETVRSDFVANVSHELRTPLASIRAMAETLQDGALSDPEVAGRFLGSIIVESDRLTRIARDLLILSAAESGPPDHAPVDLTGLLQSVVQDLRSQADRAGRHLSAAIDEGLRVTGSIDQLRQIFLNLIDNALKYTTPGGSIEVSAERKGRNIVIRVRDTGIGILSEHLPRIFERFYRVDKGRSRESGGTGLGLSIVKHITESHGGTVSVESEYNRGSTFTVSLPATQDSDAPVSDAESNGGPPLDAR